MSKTLEGERNPSHSRASFFWLQRDFWNHSHSGVFLKIYPSTNVLPKYLQRVFHKLNAPEGECQKPLHEPQQNVPSSGYFFGYYKSPCRALIFLRSSRIRFRTKLSRENSLHSLQVSGCLTPRVSLSTTNTQEEF